MNITVKKNTDTLAAVAPVDLQFHLSEEMDSGSISYYKTESYTSGVAAALAKYSVAVGAISADFVGVDSKAFVRWTDKANGTALFKHNVELTEPTKLFQGVLVDGFAVTQPNPPTKTLYSVLKRVLDHTPFDNPTYSITTDTKVVKVLQGTICPQFKWNTQSTLWEVLKDIGTVIDALPRLVANTQGDFKVITYDFINENETAVLDVFKGGTVWGENINESEYNSELSAVVENLQEE